MTFPLWIWVCTSSRPKDSNIRCKSSILMMACPPTLIARRKATYLFICFYEVDFSQKVDSLFSELRTIDRIPRSRRFPEFVHCSSKYSSIYHVRWQFLEASTMRE